MLRASRSPISRSILLGPLAIVFWRTFEDGFDAAWEALSRPRRCTPFKLTLLVTAIAVSANTVFGIVCALAIVRSASRARAS